MAPVLAIEPDIRQASTVKRIVRGLPGVDLVLVDSKEAAVEAMARQLPDLILTTTLLSPRHEADLRDCLYSREDAGHVQIVTIPLLAPPAPAKSTKRGVLGVLKRKPKSTPVVGCDPDVFGGEILGYLEQAREAKAEIELRREAVRRAEEARLRWGGEAADAESSTFNDVESAREEHGYLSEASLQPFQKEPGEVDQPYAARAVHDEPVIPSIGDLTISATPVRPMDPENVADAPQPDLALEREPQDLEAILSNLAFALDPVPAPPADVAAAVLSAPAETAAPEQDLSPDSSSATVEHAIEPAEASDAPVLASTTTEGIESILGLEEPTVHRDATTLEPSVQAIDEFLARLEAEVPSIAEPEPLAAVEADATSISEPKPLAQIKTETAGIAEPGAPAEVEPEATSITEPSPLAQMKAEAGDAPELPATVETPLADIISLMEISLVTSSANEILAQLAAPDATGMETPPPAAPIDASVADVDTEAAKGTEPEPPATVEAEAAAVAEP
jgi:hypothetical protein